MRVLFVDDEPFYYKLITPAFKKSGYELEYARSGYEGLSRLATFNPDVVVLDVRLPDLTGFQIIERLRRDPRFASIPVIFVSGQNELGDKLKAFELGADDYLEKPFQPEELVARLGILERRGRAMKIAQQIETDYTKTSTMVAVHSLRGGVGCSSIAVNLALAFYQIWMKPTVLIDAVLAAGQVAMMLNAVPRVTWEDFINIPPSAIDSEMIEQLACQHESGIRYVAAPKYPIAADTFSNDFCRKVFELFMQRNEFIVIDTAHDFSDMSIEIFSLASRILLILTPEMGSLRAAIAALDVYDRLGFSSDKIKITLNYNVNETGIKRSQVEKVLGHTVDLVIPHGRNYVSRAINFGEPFILKNPDVNVSIQLEDAAYQLSNEIHKNIPPVAPTPAWRRVTKRLAEKE
ncbi:MAG: response regulator [Anaerolineales bacterium]|nr:response regulator [Anaerolineales bacterium]